MYDFSRLYEYNLKPTDIPNDLLFAFFMLTR